MFESLLIDVLFPPKIEQKTHYIWFLFDLVSEVITRRERLKSALNLRLKKRKTFFLEKNLKFSKKKILSENVAQCRKM